MAPTPTTSSRQPPWVPIPLQSSSYPGSQRIPQLAHSSPGRASQLVGLWTSPDPQLTRSNCGSAITRGFTQPTQGFALELLALLTRGDCAPGPLRTPFTQATLSRPGDELFYLIYRNKHKEFNKMRQRNTFLTKEQDENSRKRTK